MKNILVTGANGQLGKSIRCFENDFPSMKFFFTDFEELNVLNPDDISYFIIKNQIDAVINCAAYTNVEAAQTDIEGAFNLNVQAVDNICNAAKLNNALLVHISTDFVFDGQSFKEYNEFSTTNPLSIYGYTKLEGEKIALQYEKAIVIRTSWLYSEFGNNFVKTMLRLYKENRAISVVNDQVGTPTYARELAKTILELVQRNIKTPNIYHFSNQGQCSWYEFACEVFRQANLEVKVTPVSSEQYICKAKRPKYSVLSKAKLMLEQEIQVPEWKTSLKTCIERMHEMGEL